MFHYYAREVGLGKDLVMQGGESVVRCVVGPFGGRGGAVPFSG
jgi:hypothetical protein